MTAGAYALCVVLGAILGMRYLWVLFLAVMNLQQTRDEGKLSPFAKWSGYTVLAEGLVVDALIQFTVANLIWWERPQEWTVSGRVARLCNGPDGWRKVRAIWFRDTLLKSFDRSGGHG
ncbi:MAG: hypothetical protein V4706_01665 [Pseudomonadota bacterium]